MNSLKDSAEIKGVVIIGDHVQSLGIIRSLGREKIPVYLLNDKSLCIGRFSKFLKRFFLCPSFDDTDNLVKYLVSFAGREKIQDWILWPTNDASVFAVSTHKTNLEKFYKIATPSWDVVQYALNKKLTYSIAEKCNIPCPKTAYPENLDAVIAIGGTLAYPVILKPAVMHHYFKKARKKAVIVYNSQELIKNYQTMISIIDPSEIMVQEIIPGRPGFLYSFCSLFKEGKVQAKCIAQRRRQKPMDCGKGTTFAESISIPELEKYGSRLLNEIGYYGLSEIEFKKDPRDGQYKLLEINARTWLWHSLAIRCGVNFPLLQYRDITQGHINTVLSFRENIKWVHFYTDFAISMNEVLHRKMTISDYLYSLKGEKEPGVFSKDDMMPFIMETILLPYLYLTR
jgi:predicted ATP-grasp superfamily ATP-dependent carboligase